MFKGTRIQRFSRDSPVEISPLSPMASTRVRHDRGPRLTDRDVACLAWIALQYAIRPDQNQRLLLRRTPKRDLARVKPEADRLPLERTYVTLER